MSRHVMSNRMMEGLDRKRNDVSQIDWKCRQDNHTTHQSGFTTAEAEVKLLEWPSQNPDLNPRRIQNDMSL